MEIDKNPEVTSDDDNKFEVSRDAKTSKSIKDESMEETLEKLEYGVDDVPPIGVSLFYVIQVLQ